MAREKFPKTFGPWHMWAMVDTNGSLRHVEAGRDQVAFPWLKMIRVIVRQAPRKARTATKVRKRSER